MKKNECHHHWLGLIAGARKILCALILLLAVGSMQHAAATAQQSQKKKISLNLTGVTLKQALEAIQKESGYGFLYSNKSINDKQVVTVKASNAPIAEILTQVFANTSIEYRIDDNQIILSNKKSEKPKDNAAVQEPTASSTAATKAEGNSRSIKGKVVDENGIGIPGATIRIKGTTIGTATDIDGNFSIQRPNSNSIILATFIGYQEESAQYKDGLSHLQFRLIPDSKRIEEVVVTGYQTISKERATGSFAVISPSDMKGKMQTNILERMEGMVAGVSSYKGGDPVIRGIATINTSSKPLYVVDGIPFEGDIAAINPTDIVNISILKDATAASIYGARSTNGVIVITTNSGSTNKVNVSYSSTVKLSPMADRDHYNLMSSAEFVDYQVDIFNRAVQLSDNPKNKYSVNPVYQLLFDHRDGRISQEELNKGLEKYRNLDNYDQVRDEFLNKVAVNHQHNLSFRGGSDFHKYYLSANYQGNSPYEKGQNTNRIGFNVKNSFNFTKWLKVDVGLIGSNVFYDYDNGVSGMGILSGSQASYNMLRDEQGNPVRWNMGKSEAELQRLIDNKLLDERYYAVNEKKQAHKTYNSEYLNLNVGANIKLIDNLNLDLRYQNEGTSSYNKQYYSKDAYNVKTMINDATVLRADGTKINHIPLGGQVSETNGLNRSHTLRAQLNYSINFNERHDIQVLAGIEQRKVVSQSNGHYRYGYDDDNLSFSPIDEVLLGGGIKEPTQSITGKFTYMNKNPKNIFIDDRFVSFYGNASYSFDRKLTANASIRMDQSNLFGTDPKYQYKPLWSAGLHYVVSENQYDWLDRLAVRATYGINGNVYKKSGPYIISEISKYVNWDTNEKYATIFCPPNSALRWEKTKTTNLGIDFSMFQRRLSGSIEWYNKNTTDLIGERSADPTFGWDYLVVNYAGMSNRGIEVSLQSENIRTKEFSWNTNFIFSYNKNKIKNLENSENSTFSYIKGLQAREGKAYNSLYSIRWAGLDEKGNPQAYKKDGTIVKNTNNLEVEDLVYSGTYEPPYSASLTNSFRYKGFDLSFMFVYYGGHVMRDVRAGFYPNQPRPYESIEKNFDKIHLNYWQKPGDELDPSKSPAYNKGAYSNVYSIWQAADTHIERGDYIKLRDLTIGYSLPASLVKKAKLQAVSVNLQIQNLWYWAANKNNLDPEAWYSESLTSIGRGNAIPKTYTIGVSLNF